MNFYHELESIMPFGNECKERKKKVWNMLRVAVIEKNIVILIIENRGDCSYYCNGESSLTRQRRWSN